MPCSTLVCCGVKTKAEPECALYGCSNDKVHTHGWLLHRCFSRDTDCTGASVPRAGTPTCTKTSCYTATSKSDMQACCLRLSLRALSQRGCDRVRQRSPFGLLQGCTLHHNCGACSTCSGTHTKVNDKSGLRRNAAERDEHGDCARCAVPGSLTLHIVP